MLASVPALARDTPKPTNNVLEAQFVSGSLDVDGEMEAAWSNATPVRITHAYNPAMTGKPETHCPIEAEMRAMWDGPVLYLLVSVTDPLISTAGDAAANRDGVEFWIDHFNDKKAKFEEDDGTFTVTASERDLTANRAQNDIYGNVSSRYLGGYASAVRTQCRGRGDGLQHRDLLVPGRARARQWIDVWSRCRHQRSGREQHASMPRVLEHRVA